MVLLFTDTKTKPVFAHPLSYAVCNLVLLKAFLVVFSMAVVVLIGDPWNDPAPYLQRPELSFAGLQQVVCTGQGTTYNLKTATVPPDVQIGFDSERQLLAGRITVSGQNLQSCRVSLLLNQSVQNYATRTTRTLPFTFSFQQSRPVRQTTIFGSLTYSQRLLADSVTNQAAPPLSGFPSQYSLLADQHQYSTTSASSTQLVIQLRLRATSFVPRKNSLLQSLRRVWTRFIYLLLPLGYLLSGLVENSIREDRYEVVQSPVAKFNRKVKAD